jgi:mono/diheme cytochrome c family protein
METLRFTPLVAAFALLGVTHLTAVAASDLIDAERHFSLKVLPILQEKCFACHGDDPAEIEGGLSLLTRDDMLLGSDGYGDIIVPGSPAESVIMTAITWADPDLEMPPKANDRLTDKQVAVIEKWIAHGAVWPSAEQQLAYRREERSNLHNEDGVIVKTSGGRSEQWTYRRYQPEDIWAFQPVTASALPEGFDGNPIDYFVSAKLDDAGYTPAPRTDARTLARRASFSLVGFSPTPTEVAAFAAADPATAMSDLVDHLLASPHYGERWAQHWFDVARYADTAGMSNDYERSNLWRYRDYVIRSLNDDKPYDQFVIEQIAGDELWAMQPEGERDPELLLATGFLRMGSWDPAMVKIPEARQLYIDDVVNSVGQTFLSTTMRCFKCHDHKFDPLPTLDYYRVYATFAATQLAEREAPFLPAENLAGFADERAMVERLLAYATTAKDALVEKQETAARAWYAENALPYQTLENRKELPDELKPPRHVGLDHVDQGQLKVREQDEWIWTRRLERYEPLAQSVYNGPDPKFLNSRKLRVPKKTAEEDSEVASFILTGGSLEAPGIRVQPGVLSALGLPVDPDAEDPYVIPDDLNGRRLAFAQWVADERNPLTARTIVNRVWLHHFGKPLAGNPVNFGVKGQKPTHPKLLDWLAADFMANGWKLKRLHKLIMTSAAYQMDARHPQQEALANQDPRNDLLAFFPNRRLTAEELRDSMLRITGELNPEVGGRPIMPEMNREVALQPRMIQFSIAPAYQPSIKPGDRNRRSVYAYRVRGLPDPFLEIFNQPNPNDACERRDDASVSPQAFTLMNSDVMTDRSIAFARRLEEEANTLEKQIDRAFALALNRAPSAAEKRSLLSYGREMQAYHRNIDPDPVTYPTKIIRSLVEEFSGKPFSYEEILPAYEHYQPDAKAADVAPATRALADICLLIFNTNEFIYNY